MLWIPAQIPIDFGEEFWIWLHSVLYSFVVLIFKLEIKIIFVVQHFQIPVHLESTGRRATRWICHCNSHVISNGNWTEWTAIWSEIICVILKPNEHAARVWFWNHKYDFRPKLRDTKFNYHFITPILKSQSFIANINMIFLVRHFHWWAKERMRFRARNGAIWE